MTCRLKKPCGEKKKKKEELLLLHDVVVRKTGLLVLISLRWTRAAPWAQDLRCSGSSYEQAVARQQIFAGRDHGGRWFRNLSAWFYDDRKQEGKNQAYSASFLSSLHLKVIKIKGWKAGLLGEKRASCSVLLA